MGLKEHVCVYIRSNTICIYFEKVVDLIIICLSQQFFIYIINNGTISCLPGPNQ